MKGSDYLTSGTELIIDLACLISGLGNKLYPLLRKITLGLRQYLHPLFISYPHHQYLRLFLDNLFNILRTNPMSPFPPPAIFDTVRKDNYIRGISLSADGNLTTSV